MKIRQTFILLLIAFSVGILGCRGTTGIKYYEPGIELDHLPSFEKNLSLWTRSATVYNGLETRIAMTAIYQSWDFVNSAIRERGRKHKLSETQIKDLMNEEKERLSKYNSFLVALFSDNLKWSELDRMGDLWSIYLENDRGSRVKVEKITLLKEDDPIIVGIFQSKFRWRNYYQLDFTLIDPATGNKLIDSSTTYFKLILTGEPATLELRWDLYFY